MNILKRVQAHVRKNLKASIEEKPKKTVKQWYDDLEEGQAFFDAFGKEQV